MDELKHFRPKTYIPPKKKVDKASTTMKLSPPVPRPQDEDKPKEKKQEKSIKSSQLSSTWKEEAQKKRALKTRGDTSGGGGGWRGTGCTGLFGGWRRRQGRR